MTIYIVSHKDAPFLRNHPDGYIPLLVGKKQHELAPSLSGSVCDDTLDNIAALNPYFCELTGLYWIWKNCKDEMKGLVHYRRFFVNNRQSSVGNSPLEMSSVLESLASYDCIVPVERPLLQNVKRDYARHHDSTDLDEVRTSIASRHPSQVAIFDKCMGERYIYPYNMIIARSKAFDEYCSWLFPILFDVYGRIDIAGRDDYQKRAIGFLSERLLRVWLLISGYSYCMRPINLVECSLKERISMRIASVTAPMVSKR